MIVITPLEIDPTGGATDLTPPTFTGGVSGLSVADSASNGDIVVSCNLGIDNVGVAGYKYYIKNGAASPFAAPDYIVQLTTNASTRVNVVSNTQKAVGVRVVDEGQNESVNTDFLTVVPTAGVTSGGSGTSQNDPIIVVS